MTDTERNTALAALFGDDGYEVSTECPQGHDVTDYRLKIGDECPICQHEWINEQSVRLVEDFPTAEYRTRMARAKYDWWRRMPEEKELCRISKVSKDFTLPGCWNRWPNAC